jgi:hypothetical protein
MGSIVLNIRGSFGYRNATFSAQSHGHAQAVADAAKYLLEVEMPKAIINDHACHSDGITPSEGFGKKGEE